MSTPETKEEIKPIPTVGITVFNEDRVLLVCHGESAGHITGIYGIPSGRLEEGETDEEAARRELKEEAGLEAEEIQEFPDNRFIADIPRKDGTIRRYSWRVFRVTKYRGELEGSDETTPEWVTDERLQELAENDQLLPNTLVAIERARKNV